MPEKAAPVETQEALSAFGRKVRRLRQGKGMTLQQVADRAGMAGSTISKIENSNLSPTFDGLLKLARGLDVDLTTLLAGENATQEPPVPSMGRLNVTRAAERVGHDAATYVYEPLAMGLKQKQMDATFVVVKARAVADMLLFGEAQLIGTGDIDGDLFLLMVGAGFDGRIVHGIDPRLKRRFGKGAFVWAGLCEWLRGPGAPLDLVVDGRREKAAWAVVTNARHYAGNFVLAPDADITWPGLDVFLFRKPGRLAFAGYLLALGLGRAGALKSVTVRRARHIDFLGPEGTPVEVDGDERGYLPRTVTQGTRFLRLVMPAAGR